MMNYFLVNAVGKRRTKMLRKGGAAPQRYSQRLCDGAIRLTRGKHFPLSEEMLKKHWDELVAKQNAGAIEVRVGTPMGPVFDFATLEDEPEVEAAPKEVINVPPEPETQDDAEEAASAEEVEGSEAGGELEVPDFSSMTNRELVALILAHSDEFEEKELKKMKKSELLGIVG